MIELEPRTELKLEAPVKKQLPTFRQISTRGMFYVDSSGPFYKLNDGADGALNLATNTYHTVSPEVQVIPVKTAVFETTFSK